MPTTVDVAKDAGGGKAPKARCRGTESSTTRGVLIEAAEQLIIEEGHAAVTARKLAAKAGLRSPLLPYDFGTTGDPVIAVIRHRAARNLETAVRLATADRPVEATWPAGRDSESASLWMKLPTLANHRKAVRDEVRRHAKQMRLVQSAALERAVGCDAGNAGVPPIAWTLAISGVSRMRVIGSMLGITRGMKKPATSATHFCPRAA